MARDPDRCANRAAGHEIEEVEQLGSDRDLRQIARIDHGMGVESRSEERPVDPRFTQQLACRRIDVPGDLGHRIVGNGSCAELDLDKPLGAEQLDETHTPL